MQGSAAQLERQRAAMEEMVRMVAGEGASAANGGKATPPSTCCPTCARPWDDEHTLEQCVESLRQQLERLNDVSGEKRYAIQRIAGTLVPMYEQLVSALQLCIGG